MELNAPRAQSFVIRHLSLSLFLCTFVYHLYPQWLFCSMCFNTAIFEMTGRAKHKTFSVASVEL